MCVSTDSISDDQLHVSELDWTQLLVPDGEESEAAQLLQKIAPTLILAADVVFDPEILPALAATLKAALLAGRSHSGQDPVALVSSTVRNPPTYLAFTRALGEHTLRAFQ